MTVHDFFQRTPLLAEAMEVVQRAGMVVEVGNDFAYLRDLLREKRNQQITPPFDPDQHNLTKQNSFWVVGRTEDGQLAHTQALRLYDLPHMTLGEFMEDNFRGFPPVGIELNMAASGYRAGPGARRIRGRVCYHGEMWLDEQNGQFRGKGMSSVMTRLGFLLCIQNLFPDYIFAFMAAPVAHKGLPQRAGFMHTEPGSLTWQLANSNRALEGFLAYNSMEDLRYLLRLPMPDRVA